MIEGTKENKKKSNGRNKEILKYKRDSLKQVNKTK